MDVKRAEPGSSRLTPRGRHAILHLDGNAVGEVTVTGWDGSWGYGRFSPGPLFSQYAPLFGVWSLLMHVDSENRMSSEASRELSLAETRLDSIKTTLYFPNSQQWVIVAQLNIDGDLLEWKEY